MFEKKLGRTDFLNISFYAYRCFGCMYIYILCMLGAWRPEQEMDTLKLELQSVSKLPCWVLGTEPRSGARAAHAFLVSIPPVRAKLLLKGWMESMLGDVAYASNSALLYESSHSSIKQPQAACTCRGVITVQ